MIWALLAIYFFGGSGSSRLQAGLEHARAATVAAVRDEPRQKEAKAIFARAIAGTEAYQKEAARFVKQLDAYAVRQDGEPAQLQPALDAFRAATAAQLEQLLAERMALRALLTREEWSRAFPAGQPMVDPGKSGP